MCLKKDILNSFQIHVEDNVIQMSDTRNIATTFSNYFTVIPQPSYCKRNQV